MEQVLLTCDLSACSAYQTLVCGQLTPADGAGVLRVAAVVNLQSRVRALQEVGLVAEAEKVIQPDRAVSGTKGCPFRSRGGRFEVQHPTSYVSIFQGPVCVCVCVCVCESVCVCVCVCVVCVCVCVSVRVCV